MGKGYVSEDEIDALRMHMAEQMDADPVEEEDAIEYLVDYGVHRVGIRTPDDLTSWLGTMMSQARRDLRGRTTGSAVGDTALFLRRMDQIAGR